jgi:hypothetical protein
MLAVAMFDPVGLVTLDDELDCPLGALLLSFSGLELEGVWNRRPSTSLTGR